MNDLLVKVIAMLDKVKSAKNIKEALAAMKGLFVNVEGRLNKAQTKKNLKADLDKTSLSAKVEGKLDKNKTKQNIKKDLSEIDGLSTKITGDLDVSKTKKQLKGRIKDLSVDGTVNLNTGEAGNLASDMDSASTGATGLFARLKVGVEVLNTLKNAAREAVQNVKELDKKKIDIQMVTGRSAAETDQLMRSYNGLAKEMGATTVQVTEGASAWLRQGKTISETNELLKQSMILSKVGGLDSATATDRLTAALNGYKLSAKDAEDVVSKLTAVDLEAAVSSDEVSEALSRTATSANLAGVSMDKAIGWLTTIQETTRKSASVIGESIKSILARSTKVKLGFLVDDSGEDISAVETTLKALGIQLRSSDQEFRDMGSVLDEVGGKWDNFSSVQQRAIASAFAGVYQSENFIALMDNYGKSLEYTEVAANSAGTSLQKFGVYQEGIEAKTNKFIAAFESLSVNTIDSGLVKGILDAGTALITVVDKLGLVQTGLVALATAGALKGLTALKVSAIEAGKGFAQMSQAMDLAKGMDGNSSKKALTELGQATKGLNDAQLKLILTSKGLDQGQLKTILTAQGLSKAEAAAKLQTLGLAAAEGVATTATSVLNGAWQSLKASFMNNPIGWIIMGVTTAASVLSTVVSGVKQSAEDARQAIKDNAETAKTQGEELSSLIAQYTQLASSETKDENTRKQLLSTQESIVKLLGKEKEGLDLVNGSYKEQIGILSSLSEQRRREIEQTLQVNVSRAQNETANAFSNGDLRNGNALDYNESTLGFGSASEELIMLADAKIKNLLVSFDRLGAGIGAKALGSPEEQLTAWTDAIDELSSKGMENTTIYSDMVAIRDKYRAVLNEETDAVKALNEHTAQTNILTIQQQQGIPTTVQEYQNLKSAAVETAGANTELSSVIGTMVDSMFPQFASATDDVSSSLQSMSIESLKELTTELSNIKSATDTISSAVNEYNTQGFVSTDTLSKVLSLGNEYLQYLVDENGELQLNSDTILNVVRARLEEIRAKKIAELNNLVASLTAERQAHLNNGLSISEATRLINENTKAKLINKSVDGNTKIDVGDWADNADVKGVLAQIKLIDSSIQNVGKSFSQTSSSAKSAGKDMKQAMSDAKSAIDSLLSMTISMIKKDYELRKDSIRQEMDALQKRYDLEKDEMGKVNEEKQKQYEASKKALEDELDAYNKKIDAQLKLLDLSEDEHDYQRELAEKQKELAGLKSDYDKYANDDSAQGIKRRLELEEELKAKQDELDEFQHDKEIERQEQALEDERDRFSELQDGKIEILDQEEEHRKALHEAELERKESEYNKTREILDLQIEDIENYLATEVGVRTEAMALIDGKSAEFYARLIEYNRLYGDGLTATVSNVWNNAYNALVNFNNGQINILNTLELLSQKMNNFETSTRNAASAIGWWGDTLVDTVADAFLSLGQIVQSGVGMGIKRTPTYNGVGASRQFKTGGVDSTGGPAMLHGTPSNSEVIFNSADSKKLFDLVNGAGSSRDIIREMLGNITPNFAYPIMNMDTPAFPEIPFAQQQPINITGGDIIVQGNTDLASLQQIEKLQKKFKDDVFATMKKHHYLNGHMNIRGI